jgi:iron complex transport system substrate-binding protein
VIPEEPVPTTHRTCRRAVVAALAFVLALSACGDDETGGAASTTTATPTTTVAPTTTTATPTTTVAPTTTNAPTTTAALGTFAAGTAEAAAADAYKTVFDSNLGFDAKAKFLEDAANLRATVDNYTNAGKSFGGIKLTPTAVAITGASGTVTYDVYFGTTQQYKALKGSIEQRAGTWTVTRAEFCSFMSSARNPCPA